MFSKKILLKKQKSFGNFGGIKNLNFKFWYVDSIDY